MKSKLIIIKYNFLLIVMNIEIYEDKNIWHTINNNSNFYKEMDVLFSIVHNDTFNSPFE